MFDIEILRYTDTEKFVELKALAYAHYWAGTVPEDEELKEMLEYVTHLEDEANREFERIRERNLNALKYI